MTVKVKDILEYLSEYPPEMEIKFYTGSDTPEVFWLSEYLDPSKKFLCVDIGEGS